MESDVLTDVPAHTSGSSGMDVAAALRDLRRSMLAAEADGAEALSRLAPGGRPSGGNLLHYMALRRHDARALQEALARCGLSSLGRSESHVLATIDAVLAAAGRPADEATSFAPTFDEGREHLARETVRLLGLSPAGGRQRIMVTLPSEAATDVGLVRDLVTAGMDCARVNTAHDDPRVWEAMAANVRRAATDAGRSCRVVFDLEGPKLRTGALEEGPRVLRLRPRRDAHGRAVVPGRLRLTDGAHGDGAGGLPWVPVADAGWLEGLEPGDELRLVDGRGARRRLLVTDVDARGTTVEAWSTCYLTPETPLVRPLDRAATTLEVPPSASFLVLRPGDVLTLTRDQSPGGQEGRDARIPCTLPEAFRDVRVGQRAWFDDGRIGGSVASVSPDEIRVLVDVAKPDGSRLRAEKGINLPETDLRVPALSPADVERLATVTSLADAVALSFATDPADVRRLRSLLDARGGSDVGIVLKIETRQGFARLPELLLALLESSAPRGVMIARGDLAVECGWERLAEVQEEVLWLAEAAHTPVVWATQVLESLARTGLPSRAEITDAAMGARAECVMLNKGARIVDAVVTLAGILDRMSDHVQKKTTLLRRLRAWDDTLV